MTKAIRAALTILTLLATPSMALAQWDDVPVPRVKPVVDNHSDILTDEDFSAFRRGMRAAEDNEWAEVRVARDSIRHPAARGLLLWRIALSDQRSGFYDLDSALDELEGWPMMWAIQREAEWKFSRTMMTPELIVEWFEGRDPVTGEGRVALGEALREMGRIEEGEEQIRHAWRTQTMRLSAQREVLRDYGHLFSVDDHSERVDMLIWAGQRSAAQSLLPQLGTSEQRLATARIRLSSRSGNVDGAVNRVPDSLTSHPGLLYERARWRRRAGLDTALPLLLELPGSYENNDALEAMWTERKLAILSLLADEDYNTAYSLAANNGMSEGVDFADAEFLAGWLALIRLDRADLAWEHFRRLEEGVTTPVSLARAKYWQGRAAEGQNDLELARDRFIAAAEHSTTYYGQLALLALGPDASTLILPPDPVVTAEQRNAFNARLEIQAIRLLAEIDESYYFRVFMYHFDDEMETPEDQAMLADIATEFYRVRQAVRAAKSGRMQGMTLAERAYPIIALPEEAPVFTDPALTHSVIRQETEFEPRAVSSAGARGMMQMMPSVARATARDLGQAYDFSWLTDDPDYNLILGMAHLDEVTDTYDGSLVMALAAYNAGGHRVRRWVREYGDPREGDIDPIDWVESIPFSETRNYVQRVLENLQVYRARMNEEGQSRISLEQDMLGNTTRGRSVPSLPESFLEQMEALEAERAAAEAEESAAQDSADSDSPQINPDAGSSGAQD